MPCKVITQEDVDALEAEIALWDGVTLVSQEKIGEEWFINYTLTCNAQRAKFVVVDEIISIEYQVI